MTERSLLIRPTSVFVELLLVGNTFRSSPTDWRRIAPTDFVVDTAVALALIGAAFLINRALIRRFAPDRARLATVIACVSAPLVFVSGLASCIHFMATKPLI